MYNITTESGNLFANNVLVSNSGGLGTPAHLRVEPGMIHRANGGVLFLDEIATLNMKSQQELLTALQEKKYSITGQSEMSSGAMTRTEPVPCFPMGTMIETESGPVQIDQFVENLFAMGEIGIRRKEQSVDILELSREINIWVPTENGIVLDTLKRAYRKPYIGKLIKITLDDGTTLLATPEHPIKTPTGFMEAKNLKVEQDVEAIENYSNVLNEEDIIHTYNKKNQQAAHAYLAWKNNPALLYAELGVDAKTVYAWKKGAIPLAIQCVQWLKEKQLLPLSVTHARLPLIARVAGALFGDGGVSRTGLYFVTDVQSKADLDSLKQDIMSIFGQELESNFVVRTIHSKTGKGLELAMHNANISRFLRALNVPLGDKVSQSFSVPRWVYTSDTTKKEFFSSLLSCEMTGKIQTSQDKINFVMAKVKSLEESHRKFLDEIRYYLFQNNVSTSQVVESRAYLKKIKSDFVKSATYTFNIHTSYKNVLNLQNALIVYYASIKRGYLTKRFASVLEYSLSRDKYNWNVLEAKRLHGEELTNRAIQKKLGLNQGTILKIVGPTYGRYSNEQKFNIKNIASKFSSTKELAKYLGIPYTTVLFWRKRGFQDA